LFGGGPGNGGNEIMTAGIVQKLGHEIVAVEMGSCEEVYDASEE